MRRLALLACAAGAVLTAAAASPPKEPLTVITEARMRLPDGSFGRRNLHRRREARVQVDVIDLADTGGESQQRQLRSGDFDVLVGINLLREGLDLPEVSLVAILDADKEGLLRSETSLIQTIGRAARHVNAEVVLYADKVTNSMQRAMAETERRRALQTAYNEKHGITPTSVKSAIETGIEEEIEARKLTREAAGQDASEEDRLERIEGYHAKMLEAAANQNYEEAAMYRDLIAKEQGQPVAEPQPTGKRKRSKRR